MAQDIMNQFYTCLNLPLYDKLRELTRIIDQSSPNKELQSLFPQLISNIFTSSLNCGWGLRSITIDQNRSEFELLVSFLEPHGPMFRLCYKLLSDPMLKYNLPLNLLPQNLYLTLERGRCPQFYADLIYMDSDAMNAVALALNPFDYYIFNFALHLLNNSPNKSYWENWNSAYFALACDYLVHFLPSDPNVSVLPLIPHYLGKVPVVAPLQTPNRPLGAPSLLLLPELSGLGQRSPAQAPPRNEVWRSETVLQVFVDVWLSVDDTNGRNMELCERNYSVSAPSPERVRTARVLVKHVHAYSARAAEGGDWLARGAGGVAGRAAALRQYARQLLCPRAYRYVRHLVATWPLDASFRLVLELWLSLLQPWRYTDGSINKDRFPGAAGAAGREAAGAAAGARAPDASHAQFVAENLPAYTCLLRLVLPRFLRLDLTVYKNAVMLFRIGKVFSQPNLLTMLRELENAIFEQNNGIYSSPESSWNYSNFDNSTNHTYSINNNHSNSSLSVQVRKWAGAARQALGELQAAGGAGAGAGEALWGEAGRGAGRALLARLRAARAQAERLLQEAARRLQLENRGMWASIKNWLMISSSEDEASLEECKRVPTYLSAAIQQFSVIFELDENQEIDEEVSNNEPLLEDSSFADTSNWASLTRRLRRGAAGARARRLLREHRTRADPVPDLH